MQSNSLEQSLCNSCHRTHAPKPISPGAGCHGRVFLAMAIPNPTTTPNPAPSPRAASQQSEAKRSNTPGPHHELPAA